MLDNVDRVADASVEAFRRDHVATGRPVIIAGSYAGTRFADLADEAVLRAAVGHVPIDVRPAGIEPLLLGIDGPGQRRTTMSAFVDELSTGAPVRDCCAEFPCPPELRTLVPLPPVSAAFEGSDVVSHLFVAGAGSAAHLHYDPDLRDVLMVQVIGRKRYVIIDPTQTRKLRPESRPGLSRTSGLFLQHLDDAELDEFLRWVDASDCVLEPGEVLLIPAGAWHWVRYLDTAVSINFRFSSNPRLRFMADELTDRSVEWLCLASRFRDEQALTDAARRAFEDLVATVRAADGDRDDATRRASSLVSELCARLGLDIANPPLDTGDWDRRRRQRDEPTQARAAVRGTWNAGTRVALADGSLLVIPVRGGPLVLANRGRLAAELPQDPAHPWTWPVLAHVDRSPGVTVGELAEAQQVEPALVAEFLAGMEDAGWVRPTM